MLQLRWHSHFDLAFRHLDDLLSFVLITGEIASPFLASPSAANLLLLDSTEKKTARKNTLTFLFDRRHFNNASAQALFHGGHLVMRSERCAVQNYDSSFTYKYQTN